MDKISSATVEKVARLSRLSFSEEETMLYTGQLNSILSYMEKLNELDTEDVEPTMNPNPNENVMRDDIAINGLGLEDALSNAAESDEGYFQVPKML